VTSPDGLRLGQPAGPPVWMWHATAAVGALAAIVVLAACSTAMFITAGVLAVGAAGMAEWEALLRGRGRASDVRGLLTTVLAVSFVMIPGPGVADSGRR